MLSNLYRSRSRYTSPSVIVGSVLITTIFKLVSSRQYVFPMCPPAFWKIPGGKITVSGRVEYVLRCPYGYTQPLLVKEGREAFVCERGIPQKLPRSCIRKIMAFVTLEFGMMMAMTERENMVHSLCTDKELLEHIGDTPVNIRLFGNEYTLLVEVVRCQILIDTKSMATVHIRRVSIGNGTNDEIDRYYNLIIMEAYKRVKLLIEAYKRTSHHHSPDKMQSSGWMAMLEESVDFGLGIDVTGWDHDIGTNMPGSPFSTLLSAFSSPGGQVFALTGLQPQGKAQDAHGKRSNATFAEEKTKYIYLHSTNQGLSRVVDHECPDHLVMRKVSDDEYLCVGCGKGWFLSVPKKAEYASATVPKCLPCGPGFYNQNDTATTCLPCPIKYVHAPWDAASIDDCFKLIIDPSDKTYWSFIGYLLPMGYMALLSVIVIFISKLNVGVSILTPKKHHTSVQKKSIVLE